MFQVVTGLLPDPVTEGTVGAQDAAWSHGMAGRSGKVRAGEPSDGLSGWSFRGYLAYQRTAHIPPGAAATLRYGPWPHLPDTYGDVAQRPPGSGSVMDLLAATGLGGR